MIKKVEDPPKQVVEAKTKADKMFFATIMTRIMRKAWFMSWILYWGSEGQAFYTTSRPV